MWVSILIRLTEVLRWKTDPCASYHFFWALQEGEREFVKP